MALSGNEIVYVVGVSGNGQQAATYEPTTTADIAALGGGGGYSSLITVTSGTSVNGQLKAIILFNSSTNGPKTVNAPPATGSLESITVVDQKGDAGSGGAITFVPNDGDTIIGNLNQVYTDNGSAAWVDVGSGLWAQV